MRILIALPFLLAAAGCNVDNDGANDQVSVQYNEQRLRDGAADAARTAGAVADGVGNVAASAGRAVKKEVGDIDVDVDVNRNSTRSETGNAN